jgi:Phage capsid protein
MSTSPTITTANRQQFHDSFVHALQQKDSRFQSAVTDRGMISGSSFTTNNLGVVEAREVTGRYQDKTAQDVAHDTRIAYMSDFDIGPLVVDAFDLPKLAADPTYKYVEMLVAATNRRKDKTIYRALLDGSLTRTTEGGSVTSTAIPAGQQIAAGGTGFTKAKIIQANALFRANEADAMNGEDLYIMYNSVAARHILADTTLTSADYLPKRMLESGEILRNWLGFTWIPYEGLDVPSANVARAVAWAKSGCQFGMGINVRTDISENKSKRGHPTEAYAWLSLGATRQDEEKVVQIDFATNV